MEARFPSSHLPGFLLGAALPVVYVPHVTGLALWTQWFLLAIAMPLFLWNRRVEVTALHWLGAGFLAYAALSLLWSPATWDGIGRLIELVILAEVFCYAATQDDLRPLWIGLAIGALPSIALSAFGWPGGLFHNPNVLGGFLGLVLIACLAERLYILAIPLAAGLWLSQSRGAMAAVAIAILVWIWPRTKLGFCSLLVTFGICAAVLVHRKGMGSLDHRFDIWLSTAQYLTFPGHGIASFFGLTPINYPMHPQHVYNDGLELLFEFGLGALPLFFLFILALEGADETSRLVLVGFLVLGVSYFAFSLPLSAFAAALAAGHLARGRAVVHLPRPLRRPHFFRRTERTVHAET